MEQRINGHAYDFSSISTDFNNKQYDIRAIDYTSSVEVADVFDSGQHKKTTTPGRFSYEGSFEMLKEDFQQFISDLQTAQKKGFYNCRFNITVAYAEEGAPTITDQIEGVRIVETANSHSNGTDPSVVTVTLNIMRIIYNGVDPTAKSL